MGALHLIWEAVVAVRGRTVVDVVGAGAPGGDEGLLIAADMTTDDVF